MKFDPSKPISMRTVREAVRLLALPPAGLREYQRFSRFIEINGLENHSLRAKVAFYLAAGRIAGLRRTTCVTYARKVIGFLLSEGYIDRMQAAPASGLINRFEADAIETRTELRREAPRLSWDELSAICRKLSAYPSVRTAAELLLHSPLRLCDANMVDSSQLSVNSQLIAMTVLGGKTRKKSIHVEKVSVPHRLLSPQTIEFLRQRSTRRGRVLRLSTARFNRVVSAAAGKHVTTYYFRHAYMRRLLRQHTNADGVTDYETVRRITGHRSTAALKSAYGVFLEESDADM